jgi:fluoride exporter
VATLAVNLLGALLLGALLEALARRGPDTGRRRLLRLGLGTGVLGGFTTYSTLAVETATLPTALAVAYLAASVLLGAAAALAGVLLGRRVA